MGNNRDQPRLKKQLFFRLINGEHYFWLDRLSTKKGFFLAFRHTDTTSILILNMDRRQKSVKISKNFEKYSKTIEFSTKAQKGFPKGTTVEILSWTQFITLV